MAQDLYVRNRRESHFSFRPALIVSLLVALVITSIAFFIISQRQHSAESTLDNFKTAIAGRSFSEAIEIYRDVQASAIQPADENDQVNIYRDVLNEMESLIDQRLQEIEMQLSTGQVLSQADRDFAAGMGEVSGLRLSRFIRELCRQYLVGEKDQVIVSRAIEQLKDLDNLKDNVAPLDGQMTQIEASRQTVIEAERLLASQQWFAAHAAWLNLTETTEAGTFVQDYARQRLDDCRSAMYEPLLSIALDFLGQKRAVTAQARLLELEPIFPQDNRIKEALSACDNLIPGKLATFRGAIEHLTIKPLIVNPAVAFDGDSFTQAAQDTMLTTTEFKQILEQLYANDYILVDQSRLFPETGDYVGIDLPDGKKPMVLILEGLNYYVTRRETGNCWNIVLDGQNQICGQYPDAAGNMVTARDAEAIGILDAFVENHPDFSFDGAKGLITLTGYEGVFGYITDPDQLGDRNTALQSNGFPTIQDDSAQIAKNREQVAAIINQLKRTGWQFGSSTYGFINASTASLDLIREDWTKWQNQVGALTGPVSVLQYPNGALLQLNDERSLFYQDQGIRIFGGLGATPYVSRSSNAVYVDKVQISGYSLEHPDMYRLSRLFDAASVIDRKARNLKTP